MSGAAILAAQPPPVSKWRRWRRQYTLAAVGGAIVLAWIVIALAAPVLREQFHMNNAAYSRVVFAFMLAYTIMNGVSGPVIDRLGTRLGYALTIAWWSAAACRIRG